MSRKRLGEILLEAGVLTAQKLQTALVEQERWGGPLGQILIDKGFVAEAELVQALSQQLGFPVVDIDVAPLSRKVTSLIPAELAEKHGLIPFQQQGKFLDVAMSDPLSMGIIDELRIRTQLNVRPFLATPSSIRKAIVRCYGLTPSGGLGVADRGSRASTDPSDYAASISLELPKSNESAKSRDAEIIALQRRIAQLEALVTRDEDVLRKLLGLLVKKGLFTREEILGAIR